MNLGERISRWRRSRPGLTQDKLAKAIGVSKQAVYQWERGLAKPTHPHIEAITNEIGVTLSVFYGPPPEIERDRRAS